jgi:N-acetylneuraminic acid mutarotase
MKYLHKIFLVVAGVALLSGCLEDPEVSKDIINGGVPEIMTDSIHMVKANSIEASAVIFKHNGSHATQYGFYVKKGNESEKKKFDAPEAPLENGKIEFNVAITGLEPSTTYIIQAYAVNQTGEGLGAELKTTTTNGLGSIKTLKPDSVKGTSAIVGGSIIESGEGAIIERGVFRSRLRDMSLRDTLPSPLKIDSFIFKITGLDTMVTYYIQAFATNNFGTFTGNIDSLTTKNGKPEIGSFNILEWGFEDASYTATVLSEGDSPVTSKGVCWSETPSPTTEDSLSLNTTDNFSGTISKLKPFTKYYARAFATNETFGTTYSETVEFTTRNNQPVVETTEITSVSNGSAEIKGNVLSAGMGNIIAAGFCWSTYPNPTILHYTQSITNREGEFSGRIGALKGGMTYYIRAFAQNSSGQTAYGKELKIETPAIFSSMSPFSGDMRLPNSTTSFVIDNTAYLLGGDKGLDYTNELWAYNASDRWDPVSSFPDTPRKWQTAVVVNNIAYVFGGFDMDNNYTNAMHRYLPNQNRWEHVSATSFVGPDPMHSSASSSINTSAYFVGGYRDSILNEVWWFNTYLHEWERKPNFPIKQYNGIAVTINEVVYAGLGQTSADGTVSSSTLWSSFGNFYIWSEETSLPASAGRVRGGVAYKNAIYIVNNAGTIWEYDVATKIWTEKSTLPSSNRGDYLHCMFVLNDMIYIGLGASHKSLLKYNPAWDN